MTVAVCFADGFEEVEALTVVDLMKRAKIETIMVGVYEKKMVQGSHGILVGMDVLFSEVNFNQVDLIVLPGGAQGTRNLKAHDGLIKELKEFMKQNKKIAAICAAPSILGELGFLKDRRAVCYPGFEEKLTSAKVTKNRVEIDGNITTSRGMGTAFDFGLALIAQLKGKETAEKIAEDCIYCNRE